MDEDGKLWYDKTCLVKDRSYILNDVIGKFILPSLKLRDWYVPMNSGFLKMTEKCINKHIDK